ncbi:MAG: signal peptide peptidase SppA [Rhizomicrobium sp.]
MVAFLNWSRSILVGTLNGVARIVLGVLLLVIVLILIGMARGDGLPGNMVLSLDLRHSMEDSAQSEGFLLGERPLTVMDVVLGLDEAGRDARVKGVFLRLGSGDLPVAQAEEINAALTRFRQTGKFVIAHAQGFYSGGMGDYLTAASADQIWMQPGGTFGTAGTGAGAIFLRGLFDKIQAVPQITKRADFKSAADEYMQKDYTAPDRLQTTAFLKSWYDNAINEEAAERRLKPAQIQATFEASPQFAQDAQKAGLIDKLGYDDDAKNAAIIRAGSDAKSVGLRKYIHDTEESTEFSPSASIALIEASGEIVDGTAQSGPFTSSSGIAGDDLSNAIRAATRDKQIKVILLRVDSPGGSVSASDQILNAVKKAQAAGKPVVVSMGTLAASGGYYISSSATRIVAEPATLTGSIGVLTGKVSFGKSAQLLGVTIDDIGVGKNALFNSVATPFTPDQWANLNHQADAIYSDFMAKVATGRNIPYAQVQNIAKGRVWTGADAKPIGLVDQLGGFWTAVADAKKLAGITEQHVAFRLFPQKKGFFGSLDDAFGGTIAGAKAMEGVAALEQAPLVHATIDAVEAAPHGDVAMRVTNLPVH